jgi:hypothetical protein
MMEVRVEALQGATWQEIAQAIAQYLSHQQPAQADMNWDTVLQALTQGWQIQEVRFLRFVQAVPGVPSVVFQLVRGNEHVGIPVVVGPKVLAYLQEQGDALAMQGVRFWKGTG